MAPIVTPDELLDDAHLQSIGFFKRVAHPTEGEIRSAGIPVSFSPTPGSVRRHAPKLGEQGEEVRGEVVRRRPK